MERFMDDQDLYDLGEDPDRLRNKLLERMPGLCDKTGSNYRAGEGRCTRHWPKSKSLEAKCDRMDFYFLFVDREATERDFVNVMWLDSYGECLFINQIAVGKLESMTVMFGERFSMEEAILYYGTEDSADINGDIVHSDEGEEEYVGSWSNWLTSIYTPRQNNDEWRRKLLDNTWSCALYDWK
ncbi:uncharacterized protein F5Z01DRAFT_699543 [Emericellopsis atlantica]|uniref:Uncharacterized protein n=1 Tax=Emericellopsis atlantica TaxID=2614577 RepID=A0A9P8CQC0_9HYPO|nr:uncharacterized protein F5Z01DRAFT_699543 [Emericellopsis atlantica]KAG9255764.1 hypothetical protein F5Z01DRAFT_699543 [Emericellopsis atlantica]